MLETQKERDDSIYVKHELLKKFEYLESELAKERKIIKTWTNSGKDTHEVFQKDTVGLGYSKEDELRFQNKVKIRTHLPSRNEPVKFVPKSVMINSEIGKGRPVFERCERTHVLGFARCGAIGW